MVDLVGMLVLLVFELFLEEDLDGHWDFGQEGF